MASEIVGELRRGSGTVRRGENGRLNVTMQVDFLVVTDDKFTSREEVLLATANAPIVGLRYGPLGIPCVSKTANRSETNPLYWELSCEFDSAVENQEPNEENPDNPDPTTWIPIWTLKPSLTDGKTMIVDYSDPPQKLANTAGELYEPLTVAQRKLVSWTFNQFESASTDPMDIFNRHNTINSNGFEKRTRGINWTFGEEHFLCQIEEAELGYYAGFLCWNVQYTLTYSPEQWIKIVYSHGYNYLDPADNTLKAWIKNDININGPLLADGNKDEAANALGDIQFFYMYPQLDFSTFLR